MVTRFRRFENESIGSGGRTRRQLIVAVTANNTDETESELLTDGFDAVCPKPVQMTHVCKLIQSRLMTPQDTANGHS
jgi:CheY-like chemotaxis protein